MYDAVVVEVCDGRQGGTDEIGGIALVVGTLATDTVEQLSAEGQVGDQVEVVHGLEIVDQGQDVLMAH